MASNRPPMRVEFLIVCGVTNTTDVYAFADFFGLLRALRAVGGLSGRFFNCFPHAQYFQENLQHDRISFGFADFKNQSAAYAPLATFTRSDQPLWEDLPSNRILNETLNQLEAWRTTLTSGDILNVVLIGHGTRNASTVLGERLLRGDVLATCLGRFGEGVRINVMLESCFSGRLLSRIIPHRPDNYPIVASSGSAEETFAHTNRSISGQYRGTPFMQSVVDSMRLAWHHDQRTGERRRMQAHLKFIEFWGISRWQPDTPEEESGTPIASSALGTVISALEAMYENYWVVDATELRALASPVVEVPGPIPSVSALPTPDPLSTEAAIEFIDSEVRKLGGTLQPHPDEMGLDDEVWKLQHGSPDRTQCARVMLRAIRWRFFMQEKFFLVWSELVDCQAISLEAIMVRMNLTKLSEPVLEVTSLLESFRDAAICGWRSRAMGSRGGLDRLRRRFTSPLLWLSILIVRSGSDPLWVAKFLHVHGELLGPIDREWVRTMEYTAPEPDTEACWQRGPEGRGRNLGFFLPHGQNLQIWARETLAFRSYLRTVYEGLFGEESWYEGEDVADIDASFVDRVEELALFAPVELTCPEI